MEAEKQHITTNERTIHPIYSKNSLNIHDNRPLAAVQAKMLGVIQMGGKKKKVTENILNHIMNGEVKDGRPTGLHGYTAGALPARVIAASHGAIGSVHQIWWRTAQTGNKCSWSTMFPNTLNRNNIKTLLERAIALSGQWPREVAAITGITTIPIKIGSVGDTFFPVIGTGITEESKNKTYNVGGILCNVDNHN